MKKITFTQKIIMSFATLVLFVLVMGIVSLFYLNQSNRQAQSLLMQSVPAVKYTLEMRGVLSELRLQQVQMIASATRQERDKHRVELNQAIANFLHAQNSYLALAENKKAEPLVKRVVDNFQAFAASNNAVLEALQQEDITRASQISGDNSRQYRTQLMADLLSLENREIAVADADTRQTENTFTTARTVQLSLVALALLVSMLIAWKLTTNLVRQLGGEPARAQAVAAIIAAGDLSHPIENNGRANIMSSLAMMQEELRKLISAIRHSAETVLNHSAEIASGNRELSARTEQQSAALIETAASMEEITSTVRNNAENTRQAKAMAGDAATRARQGGDVMNQVSGTMRDIAGSADQMTEIITLIEGIAFQTNILALNAAVEAARAGEHGKGFAVVAGEVRSLAHRSSEAARNIKQLIDRTTDKMGEGSRLVTQAGQSMSEIITTITHVRDLMDEVTNATQEQQRGIEQINQAIAELDRVTQSNASMVEELATSADAMTEQVTELTGSTRVFTLAPRNVSENSAAAPASALRQVIA
ncbi:MAG TPA: methyl-accepting chemotaxis protein [Franconibacter pulveris]|nr:methyl-accepting chemotaxis protein [Franconibacter pulveris]